jgi:cytochrome c oxidase subunit 2
MKVPWVPGPRLVSALFLILSVLLLAGCSTLGGDQNTLAPEGEVGQKQKDLLILVIWPAAVIFVGVSGVLVYMLIRYRRRSDNEPLPKQIHGNQQLELAWTIAPAVLLMGLAVPIIGGIIELGRVPKDDALHIRVEAFRFDWNFVYLDPEFQDAEGNPLESKELHIPVEREVGVDLQSLDVIHSFWVPKLAGKLDVVPGRTNRMWFNAQQAGTYSAQCAELCGINHAIMRFEVIAQSEEDFEAWAEEQLSGATPASTPGAQ